MTAAPVAAYKRPVPVSVRFADADGVLATREGPVHYVAGDALLCSAEGDTWPVRRVRFDQRYEPLPGVAMGDAGRYRKRRETVTATRLDGPMALVIDDGVLAGEPGDWMIETADGERWLVNAEVFARDYIVLANA